MVAISPKQLQHAECAFGEKDVEVVLREESVAIVAAVRDLVLYLPHLHGDSNRNADLQGHVNDCLATFETYIASVEERAHGAAAVASDLAAGVEQIKKLLTALLQPAYRVVKRVLEQLSRFIALAQVAAEVFQAVAGQPIVTFADAKRIWEQQRLAANEVAAASGPATNERNDTEAS